MPTIIDVRTPVEYMEEHVNEAINIPLDQLWERFPEFDGMSKPIVVYCRTGNRSGIAVKLLRQYGIAEVINGGSIDDVKNSLKQ